MGDLLLSSSKLLGNYYEIHILCSSNINTRLIGMVGEIIYSNNQKMIECVALNVIFLLHVVYLMAQYSVTLLWLSCGKESSQIFERWL